jgi:hypothetical protein
MDLFWYCRYPNGTAGVSSADINSWTPLSKSMPRFSRNSVCSTNFMKIRQTVYYLSQWPTWCTNFNIFITILYIYTFRAISCSSSGGQIVLIQHLVSSLPVSDRPVHRLRQEKVEVCNVLKRCVSSWSLAKVIIQVSTTCFGRCFRPSLGPHNCIYRIL